MNGYLANPRSWLIGGALAAVLVFVVGWLLLIGPERSATGDLRDQTTQSEQQNALLRAKVASLKAKSVKADLYAATLEQAQAALPSDSGLPTFTRQLNSEAAATGVRLSSLVVAGVAPVTAGSGSASSGATSAPSPSPTPGASTPTTAAGGVFSVRLTITTKGPLAGQLAFLRSLRAGPRRVLVNGTQIAPTGSSTTGSLDRSSSLTTDATVFSAPQNPQQVRRVRQLLTALRG